jgi:hypothetical protein
MRTLHAVVVGLGLTLGAAGAAATEKAPQVEVCFVLDTTGSMGGLIEGAKAKIWSIANQMIAAKPTPRLRVGLIAYRDRGDEYVTRVWDLSEDIDAVYAHLQELGANGGGDGPESVNQALREAVTAMSWSPTREALKLVFLVGDSPPHMDYADDVKYPETCQLAVRKDLVVNTVQCGNQGETTRVWQEIARLAEGSSVAIGQSGDMQVVATPVDERLAALNVELGRTLLPYGGRAAEGEVRAKQARAEAAAPAAAADRLAYMASTGSVVGGGGDLVDDLKGGRVKLEELKVDQLPAELQKLPAAERQAFVDAQAKRRAELQAQVNALVAQRQAFVDQKTRELAAQGQGSAFDLEVARILRAQAARKGIHYPEVAPAP